MQQKTNIRHLTGSNYLLLPPAWMDFLKFEIGDETVILEDCDVDGEKCLLIKPLKRRKKKE